MASSKDALVLNDEHDPVNLLDSLLRFSIALSDNVVRLRKLWQNGIFDCMMSKPINVKPIVEVVENIDL